VGQGLCQSRRVAWVWVSLAFFIGLFLLGEFPASSQTAPARHRVSPVVNLPDIVFVLTPKLVSGTLAQRFPQGSTIVRLHPAAKEHGVIRLTDDFFAAADPQMSFDGVRILFSGQKAQSDHWQIWEMDLDGGHKRQITKCSEDCLRAAYLPADEIALTVEEGKEKQLRSYLAVQKTDGSNFHPITFGSAPFRLETVLADGRIVASAPWPLVGGDTSNSSRMLYTLRPDGTALESFRCEHREKGIQLDAEELSDGSLVFVRKPLDGTSAGGELMQIRQGSLSSTLVAAHQSGFQSLRQISEEESIVAKQTVSVANSSGRFDLYLFNLKTGLSERLYADAQLSSIQPVPVLPSAVAKHYWNTLNPESKTGNFISLNAYLSADDPHGRIATPISRVRVFALDTTDGRERNLGEAPVESDGSFFVQVPANWPIRFALLDAKGGVIREEHSWVWTRPGEERGCTGCHGDKAVAPENRWPLTLRRFDTPTPLGEKDHGSATSQAK